MFGMDKEKKDKAKRKKMVKKENENGGETYDKSSGAPQQSHPDTDHFPKHPHTSRETGTNTPDGFYIARSRSIQRTPHFKDVHSRKLAELSEAFHMLDFDRDGEISEGDLKKAFASLFMNVEDEEIKQMLSEAQRPLNFDAFVILLGYRTLNLDPEEVFLDALSNWDYHNGGLISYERLMRHIMTRGDKFTEEEAATALADAPIVFNKAKEKMIDYIQFSDDLCGLRKMMQKRTIETNLISQ